MYVKSKSKVGNSVLACDLQFIERTVSLFNGIYCFNYHHFESFWRCDMQMCYLDYSRTSTQRPPWGRRKWPLCRGGHYKEVGVLYDNFLGSTTCFFCAKFMLTVSHNHGNPVIYTSHIYFIEIMHKTLELCRESNANVTKQAEFAIMQLYK